MAAPILFALRVRPVYNIVLGAYLDHRAKKGNPVSINSILSLSFFCSGLVGGMNETYTNVTVPFCKVVNFEHAEIQLYRYVLVLVQYFIPLFVISFVYIQMAFRLWGSKTPGNAQDSRDITMLKNKKKVRSLGVSHARFAGLVPGWDGARHLPVTIASFFSHGLTPVAV